MKVILVSGKQGSGKTTLAQALVHKFEQAGEVAMRVRFASTIYEMHDAIKRIAFQYGIPCEEKEGSLLQFLGTEWGRKLKGDDIWVKALKKKMENMHQNMQPIFIIEDCRFKNELSAFPDAFKIRLRADEEIRKSRADGWRGNTQHQSEIDLDDVPITVFDLVVNTGPYKKEEVADTAFTLAKNYFKVS